MRRTSSRRCAQPSTRHVEHSDLVGLLSPGVAGRGGRWADLGAGEGAFTLALADLLGPGAHITAVDRDRNVVRELAAEMGKRFPETTLDVVTADFTKPMSLRDLDGVVMANSLHFVRHKKPVLEAVRSMLKPGGRLIVVEYSTDRGNPWVPHPFSFETWKRLAAEAGLAGTAPLSTVPSRYFGSLYSALSFSPTAPPTSPHSGEGS
jgi:ubiquinone/menaquinone biosynthesis C-methylase UbiE